jgi:hypothetical protein
MHFHAYISFEKLPMELPIITVDYYKSCIEKFLEDDKHDEEWVTLLKQRKEWAEGLLSITPVTLSPVGELPPSTGYALCYETRYQVVLLDQNILQMMNVVPAKADEFATHWLLQKHCWMADFQEMPTMLSSYNSIESGVRTPASDPHVEFFRQRWAVRFAGFLKASCDTSSAANEVAVPATAHYNNRRSFVILYGTGKEGADFPLQFETHLVSLIELLDPDCSNAKMVEVMCKQVTNEVSVTSDEVQARGWQLDVFLINRVRELSVIRPQIVGSVVNQHIRKLLNMKNEAAGRDLAARFTMAAKQILPGVTINALPAHLEQEYAQFIAGSDIK